jgi:hypothetical protein
VYNVACRWPDGRTEIKTAESGFEALAMTLALNLHDGWARVFDTREQATTALQGPPVQGEEGSWRDGRYRVWTVNHWRTFEALKAAGATQVALPEYSIAYTSLDRVFSSPSVVAADDGGVTLSVRRVSPHQALLGEPVFERRYQTTEEAVEAAWDRGYLGMMLYLRDDT